MDKTILEIKKQVVYDLINDKEYKPIKFKELVMVLQVPRDEKQDLREVLDSLLQEGKVSVDEKGRYKIADGSLKTGIFTGSQRGFGFVTIEGEPEDIFIPENAARGALHKDTVQVRIVNEASDGKRREGEIVAILDRSFNEVVGTFEKSKNFGFVVPDNLKFNKDIFIPKEHTKGAVSGHKVVVKITNYGGKDKKPEGKVIEILGHINDPGVDIISIIKANNLPTDFPDAVMRQVERTPDEVDGVSRAGRMDIRDLQTVTIDGEDAKDLDDAITLSKEGDLYKLGVHIADVTNYVTEGSPLDQEALKRGTSVYLVDRVIPMLPHRLSNGICSLNQGTDRLALSCFMDIDDKGNVVGHKIAETIINVDRRMTYTSVKKIVEDKDEEERKEYEELVPMFEMMKELADILREKRRKRGSIDFDFPESKIRLDEDGFPVEIKAYERNSATKIIEDFMLIANETVAEDFFWQELPFVYRSHDNPDPEKIEKLGIFINNFGYSIKIGKDEIHPKELQKLLLKIDNTPEEALISRLTLRSMKQAKYTTSSDGHFGLATKYYCHFTSPIRRYPDLQIHRIIKENLRGGISEKRINHYDKILPEVARQSSVTERRADESEREVQKLKKVEYMSQYIGETFEGVISGITNWGFYVELPNTVEGMVRVASLDDDFYIYDEEHHQMIGEHTRKVYKLGEKVAIEVVGTDKLSRTIDFEVADIFDEEKSDSMNQDEV
ncbi:ribonuclease R [Anaeromicropila herbilytica]|uniref:Ribonuclease R n=1 Tax=Anaeromicropila herbilytica TaxID=2785025 RepID=A0A7R7EKG4_9FIRM|nr:ribonuclease R [Anaeromicropila herbilytica]BCN30429.1 ribonuclease R [Anaeromicropila herbilytica]